MPAAPWNLDDVHEDDKHHVESVIWVGASTIEDKKWPSSNYGPIVDLFAPGENIESATHSSDNNYSAKTGDGTSFVSPDNKHSNHN